MAGRPRTGGYIRPDGYREVWRPGGKRKTLEHRVVMERVLGRPLKPGEQVHHIDGDRLNNSPSNLELVQNTEHRRVYHVTTFRDDISKQCTKCREIKPRTAFSPVRVGGSDPHHTTCKQCLAIAKRERAQAPARLNARIYT